MFKTLAAGLVAAMFVTNAGALQAASDAPTATAIIFDHAHLANVGNGEELVYKFQRKSSDQARAGESFNDEIKLKVAAVSGEGKRTIELQIYSGDRARELQRISELTINPMFVVTMQQVVATFKTFSGGDFSYLKNRLTKNVQDKATVTPVKIAFKDQTVDGFKIEVEPFAGDPSKAKMRGYEASKYTLIVSDKVPGEIVEAISDIQSLTKDAPSVQERTTLAGFGGLK